MSAFSAATADPQKRLRRLLWLLVFLFLFIGALNIILASLLPGVLQRWLHERGLEAQISHIQLSLPRLRAELRGLDVRNEYGRGLSAREATLGLSWWYLLRGKVHIKLAELEGVHFDLETEPGKQGRVWEVGGWRLGEGPKKPKDWRVELASAKVRDGVVCYQHKPQWRTASCARVGYLALQDFFVSGFREQVEPLQFAIGADDIRLEQLVAWDENPAGRSGEAAAGDMRMSSAEDPFIAAVVIKAEDARFDRPGNRLQAGDLFARKFAGCASERWSEVIPGLKRIVGHCATARRLHGIGPKNTPLEFVFGKDARVRWQRLEAQEVRLRHANRRYPNWRAQTMALNRFDYRRPDKAIQWQSAGASGFDWCPNRWRRGEQHYCLRASSLRLPLPAELDWSEGLATAIREVALTQVSLLDVAGSQPANNPVTANNVRLGVLEYHNRQRQLSLGKVTLDSVNGCIPGPLWGNGDHCVKLQTLQVPDEMMLQFARRGEEQKAQSWAFESGPFSLTRLQLKPAAGVSGDPLSLEQLHWAAARLQPDAGDYLLQDIGLESLYGCAPKPLRRKAPGKLCAVAEKLQGEGSFMLQKGTGILANWGRMRLDRLQLSDRLDGDSGVRLTRLRWNNGLLRRQRGAEGAGIFSEDFFTAAAPVSGDDTGRQLPPSQQPQDGAEKGLLPEELQNQESSPGEVPAIVGESDLAATDTGTRSALELEQESASLATLEGCLPQSWSQLIYGANPSPRRPSCFFVRNLQQQQPLQLAVEKAEPARDGKKVGHLKFHLAVDTLTLEAASIGSAGNNELLAVENLTLPQSDIRIASAPVRAQVQLPSLSLDSARWCGTEKNCLNLQTMRTGDRFNLAYDRRQFSADLNGLVLDQLQLGDGGEGVSARVDNLQSLKLKVSLPRQPGRSADWQMQDLKASRLDFCLPASAADHNDAASDLPRCIRAEQLRSSGNGITINQASLSSGPQQPAQIQAGGLGIERIAMVQPTSGPLQLNLHDIVLDAVGGCGLKQWLKNRGAAASRWAGCLESGHLRLAGDNLFALGGDPVADTARSEIFSLGPLQGGSLQLRPQPGAAPLLQLGAISWKSVGWSGGRRLRVAGLRATDFSGCLPDKPGEPRSEKERYCAGFAQLQLPGQQLLTLGEPLIASGAIDLNGFYLRQGDRQRMHMDHLEVSGLRISSDRLQLEKGEISGLSACMGQITLDRKTFDPCFQVGRVVMAKEHRVELADPGRGGRKRQFHDLRIEGLQLTQSDFPAGLPSQLLHVETLEAQMLGIGSGEIRAQNLLLGNVSSCVPAGYIKGVQHCMNIGSITGTGSYRLAARELDLALLDLSKLTVLTTGGDQLLEMGHIQVRQLLASRTRVQFDYLETGKSRLLRREERSQEYVDRQWNSEFEAMRVNRFEYGFGSRTLDIGNIELVRPRTLIARDIEGNFGAWERFHHHREAASSRHGYWREDVSREANRFHYRISEVYVDSGHFLWLDNTNDFSVRLPISDINLLLRNLSNYLEDAPGLVLLNARPGGFGELQLAGQVDLLQNSHWNAGLLGYINDADLIPATPYMAGLLGYKILQGQLDAVANMQVLDNQVDALANMALRKIKVRRVRDLDHLNVKKSFIPLSLALALLKNGNGDVYFDMPVSGDLFDPKFSMGFVFSELLQRAILETLFAYFTPVGVYSLAKLAWARFRAVRFSPLEFIPGSDQLTPRARAELTGMVEKMRDNPQARPGICGVSTALDLEALFPLDVRAARTTGAQKDDFYRNPPRVIREELLGLAGRRSHSVQQFLIDAGLDAADFIQCAPDYIGNDFDDPRVELSN